MALAGPTGGQVVAGQANITTPSANGTVINQSSQRAVINWQQFSVGANQYVQFIQPNSSSVVLNRVIGGNISNIFGDITANGQVFLINPNGILFGKGATLDVSGLVAGTQGIGTADFMAGKYSFTKDSGAPDASVINQGTLTSANGYVVLAGDYVENDGVINAQSGRVLLAAGGATTLTLDNNGGLIGYSIDGATLARLAGVSNTGEITADGGAVVMTADVANALTATAVNNSGFVSAHSITSQNGVIILAATGGGIENSGTLDASATQAGVTGGTVIIHGNEHTQLDATSVIDAEGDGAKGGFIELSGHTLHVGGDVDSGKGGSLLIDPSKINIVAGNTDNDGSAGTDSVGTGFIATQLHAGHNVTLVASHSILRAGGSHISPAAVGSLAGNLRLQIGTVPTGGSCGFGGICVGGSVPSISVRTGGTINISGISVNIKGDFYASATRGLVTLSNVVANAILVNGDDITAGNLTATGNLGTAQHLAVALYADASESVGEIHVGNITATGGEVLIEPGGSFASVTVGKITATGQAVDVQASYAELSMGSIKAKTLVMTNTRGYSVKLHAVSASGAFATGSLAGDGVDLALSHATLTMVGGSKITATTGNVIVTGGHINLGSVSAAGSLVVNAHGGFSPNGATITVASGKTLKANSVTLSATSSKGAAISVGSVTATHGLDIQVHNTGTEPATITGAAGTKLTGKSVDLYASDAGYGGVISLNNVSATNGDVRITTYGGYSGGSKVITVGSVNATHGSVQMDATRITSGPITATGAGVFLTADGSQSNASIRVNGNIHAASSVRLQAIGNHGGYIHVTGSISAGISAGYGNVNLEARNNLGGSGGVISAGKITTPYKVLIDTRGGGEGGGNITVGAIKAGGTASINATYVGNSNNVTAQTGAISAGAIDITVKGKGAKFTAPSLKATGPSSSPANFCSGECGRHGTHSGYIYAKVTGNAGSASFDVPGTIVSKNGAVYIAAGQGAINTGDISGNYFVYITGNDINVGSVTAGSRASLIGNSSTAAAHITANGLVKGKQVYVNVNNRAASSTASALHGGSINLKGGASATGIRGSEGSGTYGLSIVAYTKANVRMNIKTGALYTAGGDIDVRQRGASGSVIVNGAISAATGNVMVSEHGYGGISVGAITAKHSVSLSASHSSGGGASIKVNGGITAGNIVLVTAARSGGNITVTGGLTAKIGNIYVDANTSFGYGGSGGNINITGATKASHGSVSFFAQGAGRSGGNITVGAITAAKGVFVGGNYIGTTEAGASHVKVQTGTIIGEYVDIRATGPAPIIQTGAITADGASSNESGVHDYVHINAFPTSTTRYSGSIDIGGAIKSSHGNVGIGTASHASGAAITAQAITAGAGQNITISGSVINVGALTATGGNVSITGVQASSHSTEITTGTIKAGYVNVTADLNSHALYGASINLGKVSSSLEGGINISAKTSAPVGTQITVAGLKTIGTGDITVTQEGGYGGIKATGLISAGNASVNLTAQGGSISVAAIKATRNVSIVGSGSHAGNITVNGAITAGDNISLSDAGIGAAIKVTGIMTATAGDVGVSASGNGGTVTLGAVTARDNISISGNVVNVGALTATSGDVSIYGDSASNHAADITVTGAIKAQAVKVIESFGTHAAFGGSINLQGNVTATGTGEGGGGDISIEARGNGTPALDMQVNTAGLKTTTGDIYVMQGAASGGIHATGLISAANGSVDVSATGSGGITLATVKALHNVSIGARGSHAGSITINGSISGAGEGVYIVDQGQGNIHVTGKITVGSTESNAVAVLSASAGTHSGGNITVGGKITSKDGSVSIITKGGGEVGGQIHVGSISALDGVKISASYTGNSPGFTVKTGKITGEYVNITLNGKAPVFSNAGITANGASSNESGVHDYVDVQLNPTNHSSGSIHITGSIKSVHGDVTLSADQGAINVATGATGKITAGGNITITGGNVQLGSLSAASSVIVTASDASRVLADNISITGDVSGAYVKLTAKGGSSGGGVTVNGKITAVTNTHAGVSHGVKISGSAGTHAGGHINVTGKITTQSGSVQLFTEGAGNSGGNITIGNVSDAKGFSLDANHIGTAPGFKVKTGNITAGFIFVSMSGQGPVFSGGALTGRGLSCECDNVTVQLHPTGASDGSINITGKISTTGGGISLTDSHGVINLGGNSISATGTSDGVVIVGGQLHLGNITATGGLSISARAAGTHAASITAPVTDLMTAKWVHLTLSGSGGSKGGKIAIGGVTANGAGTGAHSGQIDLGGGGLSSEKVTVSTGALTAVRSIDVQFDDGSGNVTLGKLDAPSVKVDLSNGNLKVGQVVTPSGGASLSAGNGSLTVAATGSLDLAGDELKATKAVKLDATKDLTLGNFTVTGSLLSASAGNDLTYTLAGSLHLAGDILKAGKILTLSGTKVLLGDAKLTAGTLDIHGSDITNSSAHGSITAAGGTMKATGDITLDGEMLHVTGAGPTLSAAGSVSLKAADVSGTGILSVVAGTTASASGLQFTAAGLNITAGQDADLKGAAIAATKTVDIKAHGDVLLSGAHIAGSAVGISASGGSVTNGGSAATITGGTGGIKIKAKKDVALAGETLHVGAGPGALSAGGQLDLTGATLTGGGKTSMTAGGDIVMTGAKLTLGSLAETAGGSVDLSGVNGVVTNVMLLKAKGDIVLSGVNLNAGAFIASASGTIHNGGGPGAITAKALAVVSKKDINLSSTDITIGSGAVPGFTGDTELLAELAGLGIAPTVSTLNGAFLANGTLTLGHLTMTGDYLMLQGTSVSILGPVSVPAQGFLVQLMPADPTAGIGVEGKPATTQVFNVSNDAFFALFPGDTIVVGDDTESGAVFIGTNGPFTLAAGTNLFFDTSGPITGLGLITSSGLVASLETLVSTEDTNIVTAGEIDPTTKTGLGDQTDKRHLGQNGGAGGGGIGGTIADDDDPSGVCH